MTHTPQIPPSLHHVVVAAPPGAMITGTVGPLEALHIANQVRAHAGKPPLYRLTLAGSGRATAADSGVTLTTTPLGSIDAVDTLLVGGGPRLATHPIPRAFLHAVAPVAARAGRVVSVCGGAFVLGALGHLEGRRCTTHWLHTDDLAARFPGAHVVPDALYTRDGAVWTAAGVTAGIDLALQLIRVDGSPSLARAVAKLMVVFVERPGGQSQFGAALSLRPTDDERLRHVIAHVCRHPDGDHRVERLASRVGMSPRHFARVFRRQTGESPAAFVVRARVEAAQRLLTGSGDGVAAIATAVGFGSEETLRRAFVRVTGVPPSAWRARFRGSARE